MSVNMKSTIAALLTLVTVIASHPLNELQVLRPRDCASQPKTADVSKWIFICDSLETLPFNLLTPSNQFDDIDLGLVLPGYETLLWKGLFVATVPDAPSGTKVAYHEFLQSTVDDLTAPQFSIDPATQNSLTLNTFYLSCNTDRSGAAKSRVPCTVKAEGRKASDLSERAAEFKYKPADGAFKLEVLGTTFFEVTDIKFSLVLPSATLMKPIYVFLDTLQLDVERACS